MNSIVGPESYPAFSLFSSRALVDDAAYRQYIQSLSRVLVHSVIASIDDLGNIWKENKVRFRLLQYESSYIIYPCHSFLCDNACTDSDLKNVSLKSNMLQVLESGDSYLVPWLNLV